MMGCVRGSEFDETKEVSSYDAFNAEAISSMSTNSAAELCDLLDETIAAAPKLKAERGVAMALGLSVLLPRLLCISASIDGDGVNEAGDREAFIAPVSSPAT